MQKNGLNVRRQLLTAIGMITTAIYIGVTAGGINEVKAEDTGIVESISGNVSYQNSQNLSGGVIV